MDIQLSPEQEDQIKQAWELFDEDDSGSIEHHELKEVMVNLGLNPTQDELDDIIRDIDKDMDGLIDYNEFLRLMSTKLKDAQTQDELFEAFLVFDNTGKKYFTARELTTVSNMLKCDFSAEDISEMIAVADLNGDQKINFDEFVRIMLTQE